MALSLEIGKDTLEVISSKDGALGVVPDAPWLDEKGERTFDEKGKALTIYGRYLDTLDESVLQLKADVLPTRFVLKKLLAFGVAQKIKTQQSGVSADGKVEVRMGYIMDEVRAALVGVENPGSPSLEFKKDADGYACKHLVALLESAGILNELFAARQGAVKAGGAPKKS